MSNKPEHVFKVGPVRASVFHNQIVHNGKSVILPKVVIEVRYKDKNGEWKGTNSLSVNDLPKAILALQQAYEQITTHRNVEDKPTEPGARPSSPVVEKV